MTKKLGSRVTRLRIVSRSDNRPDGRAPRFLLGLEPADRGYVMDTLLRRDGWRQGQTAVLLSKQEYEARQRGNTATKQAIRESAGELCPNCHQPDPTTCSCQNCPECGHPQAWHKEEGCSGHRLGASCKCLATKGG